MQQQTLNSRLILAGLLSLLISLPQLAQANSVEIIKAKIKHTGNNRWSADVTLKHQDTGWEHYADAWRVVDASGKVLGTRVLYHPHVNEQPFTRSLSGIDIPASIQNVFIEAHDKKHGWSKQRYKVTLKK